MLKTTLAAVAVGLLMTTSAMAQARLVYPNLTADTETPNGKVVMDFFRLFGQPRGHLDGDEESVAFQALHFDARGAVYFVLFR